ncbi:Hypothetical predicted protein [Pelobates cultripes]|uniref:Uncharacterized protein n=1 Tax=Pelobates cultripes TaxID=61616 RepID=A0AAD1T5N6_PELCU|nr:Hypothetical predicted protein [Pelobates cultripes]
MPTVYPWLTQTNIGNIAWFNPVEVSMTLTIRNLTRPWFWRLNPTLFHNKAKIHTLTTYIKEYFDINIDENSPPLQ